MKTNYTVSSKELSTLIAIAHRLPDDNWEIANLILDIMGMCPESDTDWNSITNDEIEAGFMLNGFVLCSRDQMHALHQEEWNYKTAKNIIASWAESIRRMDQRK